MGDSFAPNHILYGSNYGIWEPRMKAKFQAQKLWMIINENQVAPSGEKEFEAYNTKNALKTSIMFHVILDKILLMISSSNYAKAAWDKLKSIYLGTKFSRRFTIL